ncbi:transposase [Candidatus Collierbacteria bacterium]|nr:transposase [Candidatus Collierbacteria bacterium]
MNSSRPRRVKSKIYSFLFTGVERFNRTIQDEFLNWSDELYYDLFSFEEKLLHYLNWYNTKRPHYSLKMQTPIAYLQQFL